MPLVYLKIRRSLHPEIEPYWEDFKIAYEENMTVLDALREIQKHPVNARGEATVPLLFQASCGEEVCGTCTIKIDGKTRPACSARLKDLPDPLTLEPLKNFPLIRDLVVDRTQWEKQSRQYQTHQDLETITASPPPRPFSEKEETDLKFLCIHCGVCQEFNKKVMSPETIVSIRRGNLLDKDHSGIRLKALMGKGGIDYCSHLDDCERLCPKEISLTEMVGQMKRATTLLAFKRL